MLTLRGQNVCDLWSKAPGVLQLCGEVRGSRNGPVLVAPSPVISVYENPCERVLLDPSRDANPFFHLFESLWMLAGRDDSTFLDRFVKDVGARFAEPRTARLHGAYGRRWRSHFDLDQLDVCVERLRKDPDDRRVVIAMWDPNDDLIEPDFVDDDSPTRELLPEPRDLPCNTHIYLRVRSEAAAPFRDGDVTIEVGGHPVLDLTVSCRSNDVVWGAYGANAVHFSVLQEYLAGRIGVAVGRMYQFSNNWHAYKGVLDNYVHKLQLTTVAQVQNPYEGVVAPPVSIGREWEHWDSDLRRFLQWTTFAEPDQAPEEYPRNPWFHQVAEPMFVAHHLWSRGERSHALEITELVMADDWRTAAVEWMQRRISA